MVLMEAEIVEMAIENKVLDYVERAMDHTIELADNAMLKHRPDLFDEWDFEKNDTVGLDIYKVVRSSKQKAWWICEEGHSTDGSIANRIARKSCRVCSNKEILIGFNDMWTTNPKMASMLLDPNDGFKYTYSSNKKVDWKCIDCGEEIYQKYINNVNRVGLSCPICSDGVSFPEKFIYHILREKEIEFKFEKIFDWAKGKKYDFHIPSLNCIIEVHGEHHYTGKFKNIYMRDESGNDTKKKELALQNGIQYYVEIDARISTGDYITNSILGLQSPIKPYLITDFKKIEEKASNTLMKDVWGLWNQGLGVMQITEKMYLSKTTIRKYLKRGSSAGKCDYSKEMSRQRSGRTNSKIWEVPIVQLDKEMSFIKIWQSAQIATVELNISSSSSIHGCCKGNIKTAGGFRWKYLKDYSESEVEKESSDTFLEHQGTNIVQLTPSGEFVRAWKSLTSAGRELDISSAGICSVCSGKQKLAGGHLWAYEKDYNQGKIPEFKGKDGHRRKVVQLTKNMEFIKLFNNMTEAAQEVGLSKGCGITLVCQGSQKSSGGFKWMYAEDYYKEVN